MTDELPVSEVNNQLVVKPENALQQVSLEEIGSLTEADAMPFDLMSDYWSPIEKGECRRVLFDRIQPMGVVDQTTGEVVDIDCAFFFYQEVKDGPVKQIRNGSKRLVGAIQAYNLPRLTPLLIRYLGKIRNKNNANLSDNWTITPLRVNVTSK